MYLKRLDLTGFKTFAAHTEFALNSGVTAIVGPNGCGKSNVADAVRWVLGEQSMRLLRAKKAEDLIYGGSASRAALGMAEVTMTLDNGSGWLPVPYVEVAITRRAYRSGENEYFINRQRVRYRDVAELLAKSGLGQGSYTIIGQGLVDAMLSLKPEERRAIFEDAANIRHYYNKLDDARNKLEQNEQNITRINDIIAEIQPRLSLLENQAKQAEQHRAITQELAGLLRLHYLGAWRKTSESLVRATDEESRCASRLTEQQGELDDILQRTQRIRQAQADTRAQLSLWRDRYSSLRSAHDELHRKLAVGRERLNSIRRQSEELTQDISLLTEQHSVEMAQISEAEKQAAEMISEREKMARSLRAAEARLEEKQRERQTALSRLSALHSENFQITTSMTELRGRLTHGTERRSALQSDLAVHHASAEERQNQIAQVHTEMEAVTGEARQIEDDLSVAERAGQQTQQLLSESLVSQQKTGEVINEQTRLCQELRTRMELISKWEHSYSGYFSGVKAVLHASRIAGGGTQLTGIVGVAGKLILARPEMETAIEVALGSHVQDIVVERWQDAEQAISLLKRISGGRATFLPLDTIRHNTHTGTFPRGPGVFGLASELVRYESRFEAVVRHLLGHTLIVQDLAVARRVLAQCNPGWQIVTLAGEIVRSNGAVTGGSTSTSSGILARQRELRELPAKLSETEGQMNETRASLASQKRQQQELQATLAKHESRRKQLAASLQSKANRLRELDHSLERIRSEDRWARDREKRIARELDELSTAEQLWQKELERLTSNNEAALQTLDAVRALALQLQQEESSLSEHLLEAKTSLAVASQRIRSKQEATEKMQTSLASAAKRIELKKCKLSEYLASAEALAAEAMVAESELGTLSGELESLGSAMQPAEITLVQMEAEQNALIVEETKLRAVMQETQSQAARAAIERQKTRDDLEALKIRIEGDLGSADFLAEVEQLTDVVEANLDDVKRRISILRDQIRKLPQVNPRAVEEYQETLERHRFLAEQVGDLQHGAASIVRVIVELQRSMAQRFEETFRTVAMEFQRHFSVLFGGGTAKLRLTDPGDISQTGVEIIAQPPGRKPQSLALLSGGERALTAAALLFALLKVNPTPICVLDEVDAALDEQNISRFCTTLKELSKNTQFVVITHNRGTMEIAETLYGISMPEGSLSRVISLRVGGNETHESQFASAS